MTGLLGWEVSLLGPPNLKKQKHKDCDEHSLLYHHYFLTYVHTQVILFLVYFPYFEKIKVGI
jgi:hypothetical protein